MPAPEAATRGAGKETASGRALSAAVRPAPLASCSRFSPRPHLYRYWPLNARSTFADDVSPAYLSSAAKCGDWSRRAGIDGRGAGRTGVAATAPCGLAPRDSPPTGPTRPDPTRTETAPRCAPSPHGVAPRPHNAPVPLRRRCPAVAPRGKHREPRGSHRNAGPRCALIHEIKGEYG